MSRILIVSILFGILCSLTEGAYTASGEFVFQEYLRWNYTYMNPNCTTPSGLNPCQDIRVCNFAAASLAIGGWPTLCGWVGKGVPKVCCGLPLVLGSTLMKRVDEEIARKRACGMTSHATNLSPTQNKFFEILKSLPKIDISEPEKFDPPLDLTVQPMLSSVVGSRTRQAEFPWMVSVHEGGSHVCAGSLIDTKHILTAAHCVENDLEQYTIHVGNLYVDEGYPINITKIRIHPGYRREQRQRDMAVLTLAQEILTPRIPHICLPEKSADENILGVNTTLLRWGTTNTEDGESKPWLCIMDSWKVLPTEECQSSYWKDVPDIISEEALGQYVCAETMETEQEGCERGAGGPLMYKNFLDNPNSFDFSLPWYLIGMDNLEPVRETSKYTLFARVSGYMDWIKEAVDENLPRTDVK